MEEIKSIGNGLGYLARKCLLYSILSVGPIPNHIAFILDGHRRYAKKHKLEKLGAGHRLGYVAFLIMLKYCYELGVKYVTAYVWSIDNFRRPREEVESLMELLREKIEELKKDESILHRYGIRVYFVGKLSLLDESVRFSADRLMLATASNSNMVLSITIPYTSTDEIVNAVQQSCEQKSLMCDHDNIIIGLGDIERNMYMAVAPDPDILVRTSGVTRLSNFLLWQSAHTLLYNTSVLWPEIGLRHLVSAVLNFQRNHSYMEKKKKQAIIE